MSWQARPDLRWCWTCGPNAKVETRETPIGTKYLCLCCGMAGTLGDEDAPELEDPPHVPGRGYLRRSDRESGKVS